MNKESITKKAVEIAHEVGRFIREESEKFNPEDTEIKGTNDLVSYVDKTAEGMLVDRLQKLLPSAGILAEEGTRKEAEQEWIIDPLDGTTNFIHGVPTFAISIGLVENNKVISGIVYEVNRDEAFYAWSDGGAYLNGTRIYVSKTARIKDSLISTGFPVQNFDKIKDYLTLVEQLIRNSHGIRRVGSAATDLAYVACGRYDAFFEYNLNPWDVAGGALLIQEAGGTVTDYKGGNDFLFGREILGGGPIHTELLETVNKIWYP